MTMSPHMSNGIFMWTRKNLGLPSLQKCVCEIFGEICDLEYGLKFEISDGKKLVNSLGRTFLPARKAREISGRISGQISEQISEKISETSFQISRRFSETSFRRRAVLKKLREKNARYVEFFETRYENNLDSDRSALIDASLWKKSPFFKPVLILKHGTRISTEQTSMRMKWFEHIAI